MDKINFKKILLLNKEYLLLFCVLITLGYLLCSADLISQPVGEDITITAFYPAPFGEFEQVETRRIESIDDPAYYADPNGLSVFSDLRVLNAMPFDPDGNITVGGMVRGGLPQYFIALNGGTTALPSLRVQETIIMGAATPPPTMPGGIPIGGKHVYYDIAEGVSTVNCSAGDVVVIDDAEADGIALKLCTRRFDPAVAGIISGEPKLYLGPGENKLPLALAGIVECKVSTENGPIQRGDLLVSASLPGHAMAAKPRQIKSGMLVGKALAPLAKGTGKILVLVNKQ